MKTLDDAVIELNGVYPEFTGKAYDEGKLYVCGRLRLHRSYGEGLGGYRICEKEQFQQRAKELGFVGRYRWGVSYETNGSIPDLPNDALVSVEGLAPISFIHAVNVNWSTVTRFKLVGNLEKPADTSYLDKPYSPLDNGADWYDYDSQKALRLPPVGVECEWTMNGGYHWHKTSIIFADNTVFLTRGYHLTKVADDDVAFRPLDHDRKAKAERKRVVDAAFDSCIQKGCGNFEEWLDHLYGEGFLKSPD